jgi:predicted outer membrane repeat protein
MRKNKLSPVIRRSNARGWNRGLLDNAIRAVSERLEERRMLTALASDFDLTQLGSQVQEALQPAQVQLNALLQHSFPIVGTELPQAVQTLDQIGNDFASAFSNANAADATNLTNIENLMIAALGPNGTVAQFLNFNANDVTQTLGTDPATGQPAITKLEFSLPLTQGAVEYGGSLDFSSGLPSLGLSVSTKNDVQLSDGFSGTLDIVLDGPDFFLNTAKTNLRINANISLTGSVYTPTSLSGTLNFLTVSATDHRNNDGFAGASDNDGPTEFDPVFTVDFAPLNNAPALLSLSQITDDNDLGLTVLATGDAQISLDTTFSFGSYSNIPSLQALLSIDWPFDDSPVDAAGSLAGFGSADPTVSFDNVSMDLGSFFNKTVGPVVGDIKSILAFQPLQSILTFFNDPCPIINDFGPAAQAVGLGSNSGPITILDVLDKLDPSSNVLQYITDINTINSFANEFAASSVNGVYMISMGSFELGGSTGINLGGADLRTMSNLDNVALDDLPGESSLNAIMSGVNAYGASVDSASVQGFLPGLANTLDTPDGLSSDGSGVYASFDDNGGFNFPILTDPATGFGLLLGEQVNLMAFKMPTFNLDAAVNVSFELGPLQIALHGNLNNALGLQTNNAFIGTANFSGGYDTLGLQEFVQPGPLQGLGTDFANGFYLNATGSAINVQVGAEVDADLNAGIAEAGVGGGISGSFDFTLNPANTNDGKLRWSDIHTDLSHSDLFLASGEVDASFFAFVQVGVNTPFGFVGYQHNFTIASTQLISFGEQEAGPDPTTVTVTDTPSQSLKEHEYTEFTAAVSSTSGSIPLGNVTFDIMLNGTVVDQVTQPVIDGTASAGPVAFSSTGSVTCSASYTPSSNTSFRASAGNLNENSAFGEQKVVGPIFVNVSAAPGGDGNSFSQGYNTIQQALAVASAGDTIAVAQGVYKVNNTLDLPLDVSLIGGFYGTDNSTIPAPSENDTVLEGEGDDEPVLSAGAADNSSTVVNGFTIIGGTGSAGGGLYVAGSAGLISQDGSPLVENCIFSGNTANQGGAVYCDDGASPTFLQCLFVSNGSVPQLQSNTASGGAVYNTGVSDPSFINCDFTGNNASGNGTAIDNASGNVSLTNCIVWANGTGSEIYTQSDSTTQTIISHSDVAQPGYAGSDGNIDQDPNFVGNLSYELSFPSPCINTGSNDIALLSTDLAGNARMVPANGGVDIGAYEYQGPTFTMYVDQSARGTETGSNWTNAFNTLQEALGVAGDGDTIDVAQGTYTPGRATTSTFLIPSGVTIQGGFASGGAVGPNPGAYATVLSGAIFGLSPNQKRAINVVTINGPDSHTTINGITIEYGQASAGSTTGGGLLDQEGSGLEVINCIFYDNTAEETGGAISLTDASPTIVNCEFQDNSAGVNGGAISVYADSSPLIANCAFFGNTAQDGGAIDSDGSSSPVISNCSFTQNTAYFGGAIDSDPTSHPTIQNSIAWNDVSTNVPADAEIFGLATVAYSDVEGGITGTQNIDSSPLFNSGTELQLQNGSPAIGAASLQYAEDADTVAGTALDLAGDNRITQTLIPHHQGIQTAVDSYSDTVDMGAYEFEGATTLVFGGSPPTSVTASDNFAYAVYVNLEQNGHLVSNDNSTVTLSIASGPAGAVLGGTLTSTVIGHQAQFMNLFITGPVGTYTLQATDGGDLPATSHSFTIIAAVGSTPNLVFIQQPTNVAVNSPVSPGVLVGVYLNGTLDTAYSQSSVNLSNGSTVIATAPVSNGIAKFSNLAFSSTGTFSLTASDAGDTSTLSSNFTVSTYLGPQILTFGPSPTNNSENVSFSQPITVTLSQDGNPLANGSTVHLEILSAPIESTDSNPPVYGTLTGSLQATVGSNGVATFTGLAATADGAYVIEAYNSSTYAEMGFNVVDAPNQGLEFSSQPYSYQVGQNVPSFTVSLENAGGGVDTVGAGSGDEIGIEVLGPNQSFYPGVITEEPLSNGSAMFSNIALPDAGEAIFRAVDLTSTSGSPPIQGYSNTFTVEPGLAVNVRSIAPDEIAGTTFSLPVTAVDGIGNVATSYSSNPVFSLIDAPDGVTLGGTFSSSFTEGVGNINGLAQDTAGTYTLQSSLGDVSFNIIAGAANKLDFLQTPPMLSAGATSSPVIRVDVEDRYGNMVTTDDSSITLSIASPAGAQLDGVVTVDAVNGVATFDQVFTTQLGPINLVAQDQLDGISPATASTSITVESPGVIYVDENAQGASNGADWADAFTTLQPALAAAIPGDTIDIAQGDYSPGGDPTDTFQLLNGVTIQGGFETGGSATPAPAQNQTILDGAQINYNVVTANGTDATAILTGVTITGGNAVGDGSGSDDSYYGGGLLADGGSPTITDCTFSNNNADAGGAIYVANSITPMLISDCVFSDNAGQSSAGAIYTNTALLAVLNSQFTNNSAVGDEGGLTVGDGGAAVDSGDSVVWVDCLFSANTAENFGGAMYITNASPTLTNCTFSANSVTEQNYQQTLGGGAIDIEQISSAAVTNCIFWNDTANSNGSFVNSEIATDASNPYSPTSAAMVTDSDVETGYPGTGNIELDPAFFDSADSNYQLLPTSPCINAGSISAAGLGTLDLAGNPRIAGGEIDMGAYETVSADVYWTGDDDGVHWNDPGNWSDDAVPNLNDDVLISAGFNAILISSGAYYVSSLQAGSPIEIVTGSSLTVDASSELLNGITVDSGATLIDAITKSSKSPGPLVVNNLTIVTGGTLDLGSGELVVQGGDLAAITADLASGYDNGTWTGTGIISSAAESDSTHLTALGVIINNDGSGNPLYGSGAVLGSFDGFDPSLNDVLIKYTYYGDADLDGKVDGSDYTRVDNGYLNRITGWLNGDFNYDGAVNGSDYTLIDNAFNTQGASLSASIAAQVASPAAELSGTSRKYHSTFNPALPITAAFPEAITDDNLSGKKRRWTDLLPDEDTLICSA